MKRILSLFLTLIVLSCASEAKDLRFVQVSDVRYSSSNTEFKQIIENINKQKDVAFTVFTGDNISKPSPQELERFLKEAKKLNHQFYIVLGDKEVNKLKNMSKTEYIGIVRNNVKKFKPETPSYTFQKNGVIFIVVDGTKDVIPAPNGYYRDDTLAWLDSELSKYAQNNIIILQHFPLIPPSKKENYYTFKPENYLKLLEKHNNVKAVISGHFGVNSEQTVNGIRHITTAPAPTYRIIDILDCDTQTPEIWAQIKN